MRYLTLLIAFFVPFVAIAADAAPAEPVPPQPAPAQPAPSEAAPAQPAPVEAAPAAPAPAQPAETKPAPAEPEQPVKESADERYLLKDANEMVKTMEGIADYLATVAAKEEAAAATSTKEPLKLTARSAVEMALAQNDKVFVAEADVDAARAKIGQAKSRMLPQAKVSSGYAHTEYNERDTNPLQTLLQFASYESPVEAIMGILTPTSADLAPADTIRQDKLTVSQVFYTGGQLRSAIRASEYLAQAQEWQKEATLAEIEFDAKRAYHEVLLSQALVRVAEGSVKTFQRNLSDAEQMLDVGMISNFEVLRAKTELGARLADQVAAKNQARIAQASLVRVVNMPQDTSVEVTPKLEWLPYVAPADELVAYANEHLPEILALKEGIKAAEESVKRVRGTYKPQVAGNAEYSNTDKGGPMVSDGWTFTVGAEWEVMAGGRRRAEMVEAKAQLDSLQRQFDDLERTVELGITQARIKILDAMAKTESERGTVELAREGLRLSELRFQEGVGTQSEILDAELALTTAQTNLVQALYEYAIANAALERAIGKSWMRSEETPDTASDQPKEAAQEAAQSATPGAAEAKPAEAPAESAK